MSSIVSQLLLYLTKPLELIRGALETPVESQGLPTIRASDLIRFNHKSAVRARGWQCSSQRRGDRAIGQALRCARRAVKAVGHASFAACRHRIEHVELLGSDGADRMAELGLAAGVQPAFDAAWGGPEGMYERRLG